MLGVKWEQDGNYYAADGSPVDLSSLSPGEQKSAEAPEKADAHPEVFGPPDLFRDPARRAINNLRKEQLEAGTARDQVARQFFSDHNIGELADMLNLPCAALMPHRAALEYAAWQYKNRPTVANRSEARQVKQRLTDLRDTCLELANTPCDVRATSNKLLDLLDIDPPEAAEDGPGPGAALLAQALEVVITNEALRHATWCIAQLHKAATSGIDGSGKSEVTMSAIQDTIKSMAAAAEEAIAYQVAPLKHDVDAAGNSGATPGAGSADPRVRFAVRGTLKGHSSDVAAEGFAAVLIQVYKLVTGEPPSVYYSEYEVKRIGECLPFVQRAMEMLGTKITATQLQDVIKPPRKRKKVIQRNEPD
jgi:hypothetical protein